MATKFRITQKQIINNARIYKEYNRLNMHDGWASGNQQQNFEIMLKISDYADKKLKETSALDVGCGTGDFSKFLREQKIKTYLGIDIYKPALKKARKNYPKEQFIFGDILNMNLEQKFDFVFCSGALTTNHPEIDNYDFLRSMVETMWKYTKIGLVFNFLTDEDDGYEDSDLFCYTSEKVMQICKEIAPRVNILSEQTPGKSQAHIFMWK